MFRKQPTDIGKTVIAVWIGLGVMIVIVLVQIDRLMGVLAQYLFN